MQLRAIRSRSRPTTQRRAGLLAAVALLGACTVDPGDPPDDPGEPPALPGDDEGAAAPGPACLRPTPADAGLLQLDATGDAEAAEQLAALTHDCAPTVVLVADDPWAAVAAVSVAVATEAPLVVADDDGAPPAWLDALAPQRLVAVGTPVGVLGADLEVVEIDHPEPPGAVGLAVADHLDASRLVVVPDDEPAALAAGLAHADGDTVVLPAQRDDPTGLAGLLPTDASVEVPAEAADADELVATLAEAGVDAAVAEADPPSDTTAAAAWLTDPTETLRTALVAAAARTRDEPLLAVDAADLRRDRGAVEPLRRAGHGTLVLGMGAPDAAWQLATVLEGTPLPWGGFDLFDDERMVAIYGHPSTAALGVLGEQDLDAAVGRLREIAAPYDADGATVRPAFELIATIASAEPGPAGDYSRRTPVDVLRPWVERAAEEGIYVLLDLQPGRTDFLTQAQEYEELLREPHVGLALDPEWRLQPDQVHLRQIGSVDADEVQQVADWLAGLTRDEQLPQKLLVLHQFRFSMLPDRDRVVAPPELAVVIHMDGQGPLDTKHETYDAITAGAEDRWLWGWKNFYDEDDPTATPEQVLAVEPRPVLVTYQ